MRILGFGATLGARGLLLAVIAATLAAGPARAQDLSVMTQTSISVTCTEPTCDCIDATGAPASCPATEVRNYDSGAVAAPTSDSHTATVSGTYLPSFDSSGSAGTDLSGDAAFGVLKGFVHTQSEAHGTYVDAGGLAIPATANGYVNVDFNDYLIAHAAAPGGSVAITLSTSTHTAGQTASLSGGGLSFDPCLSNGDAQSQLNVSTVVLPLGSGTGGGSVGYGRTENECGPAIVTGSPGITFHVVVSDGERVNFGHGLTLNLEARTGGGDGNLANRSLGADALLDASSTSIFYIAVETPGASYESGSGTVYEVPEAGAGAGALASLAPLLCAIGLRRRG